MMHRSRRSYLVAAIYEWAIDCGYTPQILVASEYPGVRVPSAYIQEGRIALNVAPAAVQGFDPAQEPLFFSARFGGRPFEIEVPTGAVLAVYARENGEGLVFGDTETPPDPEGPPEDGSDRPNRPQPGSRPKLRVIK